MIVIELVYNLAVLVALSVLSGFIDAKFDRIKLTGKILQGILFGCTAIIGMMYPFVWGEGIIFDGRSIVISLSSLFFGPISGAISSLFAILYRLSLGGGGALTGTLVILSSFLIGVIFHFRKINSVKNEITKREIYLLGLIVHVVMLLLFLLLPSKNLGNIFKTISLTVVGIYPFVTLLIGTILLDQEKNKAFISKLKESEKKFREIFNSSSEAIFIHEIESGKTIDVNYAMLKMYGYNSIDEVRELNIGNLSAGTGKYTNDEAKKLVKKAVDEGPQYFEWIGKRKNNSTFWLEVTLKKTTIDNKEYVLAVARDISIRKNAEKAVIENERLLAIGQTASAVAHDFNNSLQAIFSNIELGLLSKELTPKLKARLETIQKLTSDAAARVQLLQRLSGKNYKPHELKPTNINNVIKEVIEQTRPMWKDEQEKEGKKITIVPILSEVPIINGNENELRSAVYNLVKNAVEAMPSGGEIKIQTGKSEDNVFIRITDTGKGMDEETRLKAFQPFFTTKGNESGRGIGLSGVFNIIKEHSGIIYIKETEIGIGTTIEILIPAANKTEIKDLVEEKNLNQKKAKILWVDDDKSIREIASEILLVLDHEGTVVESGTKALELIQLNDYDLVITDIGMAEMNGWELAEKIKGINTNLKVAIISGWGNQIEDDKLKKSGADYILGKPVKIEQVAEIIEKIIGS
jgi:PAS domain S-box-containing protein